jgi:DNA polymerase-3 subunit beta
MRGTFTVPAGALASAVKYTARWLATKPVIPAQGGLLFEVDGDRLNIFGFNENATARATVEIDATDEPKGGFVVAGRLIDALVGTLPDKPITFEQVDGADGQEGPTIAVTSGRGRWTMPTMPEKDYPALPGIATLAGYVDGQTLADAVRTVAVAASRDLTAKVVMAGIHISFDEDTDSPTLTLSATDGYRAARAAIPWQGDPDNAPVGEAVVTFASTLVDAVDAFISLEPAAIGYESSGKGTAVLSLSTPARSLVVRTLNASEHPAPTMGAMYAYTGTASATLRPADLLQPMKRAALLGDPKVDLVRLRFAPGLVEVHAGAEGRGDGDEEVDVDYDGPEHTATVKATMLHTALASAPGERVSMGFTPGEYKPVVFTSENDPTWRHLLMPLRK